MGNCCKSNAQQTRSSMGGQQQSNQQNRSSMGGQQEDTDMKNMTNEEWAKRLPKEAFKVARQGQTEAVRKHSKITYTHVFTADAVIHKVIFYKCSHLAENM